jgi:hypothetical protein
MTEFSYGGGKLPHDPDSVREHERDVRDEAERDHEAAAAPEPKAGKRPWWRFWGKRST